MRSFKDMLRELIEDFASFDAKILITMRQVLFSPGLATINTIAGKRAPYTPPLRLYVIISAIIIALMSITGFVSLDSLLADAPADQIEALQNASGLDLADPAVIEKFDSRFNTLFPLFNLITPIGLALALKVVMPRTLLHAHAIAALHLATAQVSYGSLMIPMIWFGQLAQIVGGLLIAVVTAIYIWKVLRRVYGGSIGAVAFRFAILAATYAILTTLISGLTFAIALATL